MIDRSICYDVNLWNRFFQRRQSIPGNDVIVEISSRIIELLLSASLNQCNCQTRGRIITLCVFFLGSFRSFKGSFILLLLTSLNLLEFEGLFIHHFIELVGIRRFVHSLHYVADLANHMFNLCVSYPNR